MSRYSLIIVGDSLTGEHTNIGAIVFGDDGKYFGHRIGSLDRAKRRGDWPADNDGEFLDNWAGSISSVEVLERKFESIGHAMSCNQFMSLCGSTMPPAALLDYVMSHLIK